MKRTLSFSERRPAALVVTGTCLVAATYGLVRLAYGLFLPDVSASLDLSDRLAGWTSSAASLSYCVGALLGLGADRAPRLVVAGALATGAVGSAGMALAPDRGWFAALAVLGSAGAGLASPGLVGLVDRVVPAADRPRAQAVVNSGTGPGLVAAGVLALVLLPDWRLGFAVSAGLTVLAGAGVLLVAGRGATYAAAASGPAAVRRTAPPVGRLREGRGESWRFVVALAAPAVGALGLGAASAAVWTYGRTLLVAEGAGATGSTVGWIAIGVGGALTVVTAGVLGALRPQVAWGATVLAVAAVLAVLAVAARQLPVAVGACAVFGWAFVAATSALIAWAAEVRPERAAAGTALLFVTLVLGQAVGSAVVGEIAARADLAVGFGVAAGTAALAAAAGLRGRRARG
ncbi:MFS transporter [Nocardioides sp. CPCC 205120]|uniref:MFS transporter n=1 Tax=Nocardioides sp. CPCC 205120 TaxID=3406462 RepID=UPI003B514DBE